MKTDVYEGGSEPSSSAVDAAERTEREPEMDRVMNNRILRTRSSSSRGVATHRAFPFRTLIVCFTIWLIATQAMIFDQVKFDVRTQLLEQAARSLGGPQVVVPTERPPRLPGGATIQRL
jgi:hypothetical protein